MQNIKSRKLLIAIFVFAITLFIPTAVFAAQTSRTLQPGNVYEFIGRDARVISHVNVTGVGRYDIVAWDANAEITRFGSGTGRFSVSGTGGVAITPAAPLTVSFDSSRLRISSQRGSALVHTRIPVGQTAVFENSHVTGVHVRTTQTSNFDYVITNRAGNATAFARDIRLPQVSIPSGGSLAVTAYLRETTVYFPSRLAGNISVQRVSQPAIYVMELLAGEVYTFANSAGRAHNLRLDPPFADASFSFEYITRGRDGHVTSHGERETNQLQLGAFGSISITPLMDGELYFPYALLRVIDAGYGTVSPLYFALQEGRTVTVTNNDALRSHSIFVRCPDDETAFTVDYAITFEDVVQINSVEVAAGNNHTISLQPGAVVAVTAAEAVSHVALRLPDITEVTAERTNVAAVTRHSLQAGSTIIVQNNHGQNLPVRTNALATFDHVITNRAGNVTAFARDARLPQADVPAGGSIALTALRGGTVLIPTALAASVNVVPAAQAALHSTPLQAGQVYTFINSGNRALTAQVEPPFVGTSFSFEYIVRGRDGHVVSYGERESNQIQLSAEQTISITPSTDGVLYFPLAWLGTVRVERGAVAPVYTPLRAGQSVTVTNNDSLRSHNVTVRCPNNNSGFALDYTVQHADSVQFNSVQHTPGAVHTISLPADATATITALEATGHLALRVPDIDVIVVEEGTAAAVARHEIAPGMSVRVRYSGTEMVGVTPVSANATSDVRLDYVLLYGREVDSFGTVELRSSVSVGDGLHVLLTNPSDQVITLRVPQVHVDNGLTFEVTDAQALYRRAVDRPLTIENRNRNLTRGFALRNETRRNVRQGAFVLEYVRYSTGNNIAAFGQRGFGDMDVPGAQRLVVAPVANAVQPTIIMPMEWYNRYFRITNAQAAPLYRITLTPGRRLIVNNRTRDTFTIQNNSANTAAGFVIGQVPREQDIVPQEGVITVSANREYVITATSGANLELWLPVRHARQLGIVR